MSETLAVYIVAAIIFAVIGSMVGNDKKMGGNGGFWWGLLLGPFGVLLVALSAKADPEPAAPISTPAPPPPMKPAGWMPDPTGRHEHRYWDGSRWTEHVTTAGEQSTDQP